MFYMLVKNIAFYYDEPIVALEWFIVLIYLTVQ